MDNQKRIDKLFSDKRLQSAQEELQAISSEINKQVRELEQNGYNERRELQRERDNRIRAIYDEYDPQIAEVSDRTYIAVRELRTGRDKPLARVNRLVANRMKKAVAIVEDELADNALVESVKLNEEANRIRIDMKPVMVKDERRRMRERYPTQGYITLWYDTGRQSLRVDEIYSQGQTHPHGGCLNTKAYDLANNHLFDEAVMDLAMALAINSH